jgi:hypothetical protein
VVVTTQVPKFSTSGSTNGSPNGTSESVEIAAHGSVAPGSAPRVFGPLAAGVADSGRVRKNPATSTATTATAAPASSRRRRRRLGRRGAGASTVSSVTASAAPGRSAGCRAISAASTGANRPARSAGAGRPPAARRICANGPSSPEPHGDRPSIAA